MVFSTLGPLKIEDLEIKASTLGSLRIEDLETKAKNLLKLNISNKNGFLNSQELIEELDFLVNKEYIAKKEGTENPVSIYEITSKGREYIGSFKS